MDHIERIIDSNDNVLVVIAYASADSATTNFLTAPDMAFQLGFVVKVKGQDVAPHKHKPLERNITGTTEVLVVKRGVCELDVFDEHGGNVASRRLNTGDTVLLLAGGHGFRVIEDTVFLEIKQGPYPGTDEKEPV